MLNIYFPSSLQYFTLQSYHIKDNMNQDSITPQTSRAFKREPQTQGIRQDSELRSQLYYQSRQEGTMGTAQILDSIEEQIREIENKLISITQKKTNKSLSSEQYAELEDERRRLKKDLIDLDYQHKLYCQRWKTEQIGSKNKSKNNKQPKEHDKNTSGLQQQYQSQYMDGSRKIDESLQQMRKASKQRAQEYQRIFGNPQIEHGEKEQIKQQTPEKSQLELQQELILAQQRSRLAQLQLELASESLRRSREVQLQAQLSSLRLVNTLSLPSYRLPESYYLSPYSSLYRPYLGLYPELSFI